ncbi:MAG TPA: NADH-quinone oxidoreductase subunit M [Gemmatimonadaceae bacterium]|jgi:NADH-quinone oxidoreductase subunit M|nr:NADH-quinone oxidoreductase subunit M [Gemmatimonadaceae bacterium]
MAEVESTRTPSETPASSKLVRPEQANTVIRPEDIRPENAGIVGVPSHPHPPVAPPAPPAPPAPAVQPDRRPIFLALAGLGVLIAIGILLSPLADSVLPPAVDLVWVLPALLAVPLLGAVAILATRVATTARWTAVATLTLELLLSLVLWARFDARAVGPQFSLSIPWIRDWGIHFALGIDGISLVMVILTTFLMPLAIVGSWTSIRTKAAPFYALMLVLTTGMIGVLLATDLFLFYLMWEVMLIPMYFVIGMWGGPRRLEAGTKFFLYTMLGSLLMLVGILFVGFQVGHGGAPNFAIPAAAQWAATLPPATALWLFGAFAIAFAVKVPLFPFHTWLPDAYVQAPAAASAVLAGIMAKMGTFGFIRLAMPLFPAAAMQPTVRAILLTLAVVGILYGALLALVQPDFKKLVAYSSISHLGFVLLGLFALTVQSVQGAILVMINHGITTAAMFLLIGMLGERRHSRLISAYGGLARSMPLLAAALTLVSLSSIGLPGTNGFVGEFLVLLGGFRSEPFFVLVATIGVIMAACYALWAIQRMLFSPLDKPENAKLPDLNWRELGLLAPLLIAIVWLGVDPAPVLHRTEAAATAFVSTVQHGSSARVAQR